LVVKSKERQMDKEYIFESFKKLETSWDKIEFLKDLQRLNLSYDINYEALIAAWELRGDK
jgi:hypothetical protein